MALLIHYHELALKGRNRGKFEKRLTDEIKRFSSSIEGTELTKTSGRIILNCPEEKQEECLNRLYRLPGIANVQKVTVLPADIDILCQEVPHLIPEGQGSFAIRARRDSKHYSFTSLDLGVKVGSAVNVKTKRPVKLTKPELEVFIEIAAKKAYVGIEAPVKAFRGLPVGCSGKAVGLLSGGFDSPVAIHLMQCRGLEVHAMHCHSAPMVSRASIDKVKELCEVLGNSQSQLILALVPIVDFQKEVVAHCHESLRIVLYRRFMLRLATEWAQKLAATAIINGDSLGQVASQTLGNMSVISEVCPLPILRPLIGMSKDDIIEKAALIKTEDISKQPHDDCCGFLMPKNPETNAKLQAVLEAEKTIDIQNLLDTSLNSMEIIHYDCGQQKK